MSANSKDKSNQVLPEFHGPELHEPEFHEEDEAIDREALRRLEKREEREKSEELVPRLHPFDEANGAQPGRARDEKKAG